MEEENDSCFLHESHKLSVMFYDLYYSLQQNGMVNILHTSTTGMIAQYLVLGNYLRQGNEKTQLLSNE